MTHTVNIRDGDDVKVEQQSLSGPSALQSLYRGLEVNVAECPSGVKVDDLKPLRQSRWLLQPCQQEKVVPWLRHIHAHDIGYEDTLPMAILNAATAESFPSSLRGRPAPHQRARSA